MCSGPNRGDGVRRQGGRQSGAAGEMPLAKNGFADRLENEGEGRFPVEEKPADNEPANVAMGRKISLARRPAYIAARRADVRSLAMPVPSGTMNRTRRIEPSRTNLPCASSVLPRSRLRKASRKVYASANGMRIFFWETRSTARGVPRRSRDGGRQDHRRKTGPCPRARGQLHGRDDNSGCKIARRLEGSR